MNVSGLINKWIFQGNGYQQLIIKTVDNKEYKINDNHMLLDGARISDFIAISIVQDTDTLKSNNSWQLVDLLEFNRPFTSNQINQLIVDIKGIGSKTVGLLMQKIDFVSLAKLVQNKKWNSIKKLMLEANIKPDQIISLTKNMVAFQKEIERFRFLIVTNFLVRYNKCGLDYLKWIKCRKMLIKMLNKYTELEIIEIISENPYQLILGDLVKANQAIFIIVDSLAQYGPFSAKWSSLLLARQQAGVWSTLLTIIADSQDCYTLLSTLLMKSQGVLGTVIPNVENKFNKIRIYNIANSGKIVFPKHIDDYEKDIVSKFRQYQFTNAIDITEDDILKLDPNLDPQQINTIMSIVQLGRGIITGPPGVGKTKVISTITQILANYGHPLILSAPTGLACKNIAKIVENVPVYTVAKLLYNTNTSDSEDSDIDENSDSDTESDKSDESEQLKPIIMDKVNSVEPKTSTDCLLQQLIKNHGGIIIDEFSMVDIGQFYQLLSILPPTNFRIILVGDPNQLPSIGPGQILSDLIDSNIWPYFKLTNNYRQKAGSQIINNALKVLDKVYPLVNGHDFRIAQTINDLETIEIVSKLVNHLKLKNLLDQTIILSPFSKKSIMCTNNINNIVKTFFNPQESQKWGNLCKGDRVLQTKNVAHKKIVNGDMGYITDIVFKNHQGAIKNLVVEYDDKIKVKYNPKEAREQLKLAYAISIHQSQGNGYPYVILVIPHRYQPSFFNRNMLYTAITRTKNLIYMVGGDYHSIITSSKKVRKTRLCNRLRNKVNVQSTI